MNLRTLPPSMLVVLGLACSRTPPTVHPCLSQPYDPNPGDDVGPCLSPPVEPPPDDDVGPCLSPPEEPPPDDADVGPCLSPPRPQQASVELDVHEPSATPGAAGSRQDALERVLARATLPADVAERLRRRPE